MTTPSVVYRDTRERLTELLNDVGEAAAGIPVPSTPAWSLKDVVAHLCGLVTDWLDGNVDGYGTDAWTAAQVDPRREHSLQRVLDEWTEAAPKFEAKMAEPGTYGYPETMPYIATADLVVHEHDIRGALGRPGARDSMGVQLALKTYITGVRQRHAETGLGAMALRESDGRDWAIGTGAPAVTVSAPRFEIFRTLAGRRSRDRVLAYDWVGDVSDAYADLLLAPNFEWAASDLDH